MINIIPLTKSRYTFVILPLVAIAASLVITALLTDSKTKNITRKIFVRGTIFTVALVTISLIVYGQVEHKYKYRSVANKILDNVDPNATLLIPGVIREPFIFYLGTRVRYISSSYKYKDGDKLFIKESIKEKITVYLNKKGFELINQQNINASKSRIKRGEKMNKPECGVELSIVIPVMNEEENIEILAKEIDSVMADNQLTWECLWVDDMSTDTTRTKLVDLCSKVSLHKYIFHSENYGQSASLATGFRASKAKYILTLDGDGQNDPASIPDLISKIVSTDADVVNGWRQKRNDSIIRKISSKIGNGFRNIITKECVQDVGCALRIFKRECVQDVPVFKGMHRYLPTLILLC